ncbi:hypothetical protein PS862_04020 [Pseudomonas fluorescens]|uniref:SMODS and SLOG-associating 2TM effector domain-containing protein n=1 Tax=Pseudomonas fluorescens TaxID=294 RepID=A0A5E7MHS6_PSEFL|nr:hypothetical protein [Pseudomonas fluorescens]VVP24328.1 hypothetical protein PS862_04020 [Pseudomonas fluorescens]
MTEDQLNAALQAEYLHLQKTIEDFDSRALTIKAWSVTFGLVSIAGAFASHSYIPFLISSMSTAIFWLLETQWKLFQICYSSRSSLIEEHFRGKAKVEHPFQIGSSWSTAWKAIRTQKLKQVPLWPHVALPHAFVMILGILLFFLSITHVIDLDAP